MKINRKTNQCFVLSVTSCVFASHALLPRGKQIPICSSVLFLHRAGHRRGAAEHICVCVCVCVFVREVQTSDIVTPDSLISIDYFTAAFLVERAERGESTAFQTYHQKTRNEGNEDTHTQRGGNFWATFRFSGRALNSFLEHEFLMLLI